jgi:branched-chain amino acid transport system ATP-binding protein
MLTLRSVTAGYGDTTVLRGVDFSIADGEVVALLGPNGAGKTTLLRTATGFVKPRSGRVEHDGQDLTGRPPYYYARRGICHLPEGRGIFPSLTVRENITIGARGRQPRESAARVADLFPEIAKRMGQIAGSLSGGEQQMLALSRAYVTRPRLVVVDEASLGLAPIIIDRIYDVLARFAELGTSLIIAEQYVHRALALAGTVCILSRGEVAHVGEASQLDPDEIYQEYLGIQSLS